MLVVAHSTKSRSGVRVSFFEWMLTCNCPVQHTLPGDNGTHRMHQVDADCFHFVNLAWATSGGFVHKPAEGDLDRDRLSSTILIALLHVA